MLAGESGAQDVVGVGHQLDAGAADEGVELSGRGVQRLARAELDAVEQQRGDHRRVAGVVIRQLREECALGRVPRRTLHQAAVQAGSRRVTERQGGAKHPPDRPRGVLNAGRCRQRCQFRNAGRGQSGFDLVERPDARQDHHRFQRHHDLRFVAAIPIGPVRRVDRHSRALFGFKTPYGTRSGGVRLHRHRLAQCKDLEEKRQRRAVPVQRRAAERFDRMLGDHAVQRHPPGAEKRHRRRRGVRPHPQLRLRPAAHPAAQQATERRAGAPVVVLDRALQGKDAEHERVYETPRRQATGVLPPSGDCATLTVAAWTATARKPSTKP